MGNPRIDMHSWTLTWHRRFSGARCEPGANARLAALALIPMGDWCGSVPQAHRRETGCVIMLRGAVWPRPFCNDARQCVRRRFTRLPRPFNGRHLYTRNGDRFISVYVDRPQSSRADTTGTDVFFDGGRSNVCAALWVKSNGSRDASGRHSGRCKQVARS
jgi:hypothetical protein